VTGLPAFARLMAMLAWTSVAAVLTCLLLPAPGGVLGTLLIGAVALVGLRAAAPAARSAGILAAALLAGTGIALAVVRMDPVAALDSPSAVLLSPALRDPGTWLPPLAGAALVLTTALVAGWTAGGLALGRPALAAAPPALEDLPGTSPSRLEPRRIGLSQVEAERARAAVEARELSLALLGIDRGGDEGWAMALLDEALAGGLGGSDAVCACGPAERLVVLPGVPPSVLRAGAAQLCVAGADLAGRPVRAAVATFSADGSTLRVLLDRLGRDLAACRAAGAIVGPAPADVAVTS